MTAPSRVGHDSRLARHRSSRRPTAKRLASAPTRAILTASDGDEVDIEWQVSQHVAITDRHCDAKLGDARCTVTAAAGDYAARRRTTESRTTPAIAGDRSSSDTAPTCTDAKDHLACVPPGAWIVSVLPVELVSGAFGSVVRYSLAAGEPCRTRIAGACGRRRIRHRSRWPERSFQPIRWAKL